MELYQYFYSHFRICSIYNVIYIFAGISKVLLVRNKMEEAYEGINKIKDINQGKYSEPLDKKTIIKNFHAFNSSVKNLDILQYHNKYCSNFKKVVFLIYIWFALNMSFTESA